MEIDIKGSGNPKKDQSKVKTCKQCGCLYHPQKNGYQDISSYCSNECSRKARQKGGNYFSV